MMRAPAPGGSADMRATQALIRTLSETLATVDLDASESRWLSTELHQARIRYGMYALKQARS